MNLVGLILSSKIQGWLDRVSSAGWDNFCISPSWVRSAERSDEINKGLFTIATECLLSDFVFFVNETFITA